MLPAIIEPGPAPPALPTVGDDDLLRAFFESLSARTRLAYDADLRDFGKHLRVPSAREAVTELLTWGPGIANLRALEYRTGMQQRGLASSTIARRLAALRSIVRLARTLGRITWTLELRSPKIEAYRDTAGPGREGWRRLRTKAGERLDRKGVRDLAIVRLLHDLALRREEVVSLDLEHVAIFLGSPATVWILGKGRSSREAIVLPTPTTAALEAWMLLRGSEPGPLFTPLDTPGAAGRLTGRSVARIVAALGQLAELPRAVRPHGLRHQAITEALDRTGGDVRRVQRFSRHASIQTLVRYDDRRKDPSADIARLVADDS
jgi:integrase/recombinase XerC